ncbi:hypothetical protein ECTPHS_14141, partial [Ectothiorhodospira sp. PHS-1]
MIGDALMVAFSLVQGDEQQFDLAILQGQHAGLKRGAALRCEPPQRRQYLTDTIAAMQAERHILQPGDWMMKQTRAGLQHLPQLANLGDELRI